MLMISSLDNLATDVARGQGETLEFAGCAAGGRARGPGALLRLLAERFRPHLPERERDGRRGHRLDQRGAGRGSGAAALRHRLSVRHPIKGRARLAHVIVALAGLLGPASAAHAGYLEELVESARSERLAEQRAWLDLGHYRPDLLGPGHTSLIDSPGFFNAERGKTDPQAELEATLAAFFAPPDAAQGQHPQCAFVARYRWLRSALDFDPARLPEQPCPQFDAWLEEIAPERVTLVFPSAYLNNPSSMFGHTLLRLDREGQTERTRLLAYAVNYGAVTGEDAGIMFAVHGLTGGYRGTYAVLPYHAMVRQYTDYENRDIWEYELSLSPAETLRLTEHLWELRDQYANYFFFDENCSYQLLFLLDVARPGMRLTDSFPLHAIPADTVRAVVAQDGMVERTVFRPSSRTVIEHRLGQLGAGERTLVDDLANGRRPLDDPAVEALAPARRAAVLELAAEFVSYQMRTGERSRDEAAPLALQLLAARSRIAAVPAPARCPSRPHARTRGTARRGSPAAWARAAAGSSSFSRRAPPITTFSTTRMAMCAAPRSSSSTSSCATTRAMRASRWRI